MMRNLPYEDTSTFLTKRVINYIKPQDEELELKQKLSWNINRCLTFVYPIVISVSSQPFN
jgi:hypothetical protein